MEASKIGLVFLNTWAKTSYEKATWNASITFINIAQLMIPKSPSYKLLGYYT